MGLAIRLPGTDGSQLGRGFTPPLENWAGGALLFLGGAPVSAVPNLAYPGAPACPVVGTLVEAPGYWSLVGQSKYINTGISETKDYTYMMVGRSFATGTGTDKEGYCGTYGSGSPQYGASLFRTTSSANVQAGAAITIGDGSPAQVNTAVAAEPTTWKTIIATFAEGTGIRNRNMTTGVTSVLTEARARYLRTGSIRVGSLNNTGWLGGCDMAFFGFLPRAISDDEAAIMGAYLTRAMAKLSSGTIVV